ncbi:hypothetical protein [Streptomyces sp. NPDC018031]|uniref:hypothetical protein n=1 Tax=Streptomyces sp. NPDC018031 TaxID=3365033 RepID=UPI003787EDF2
MTTVTDAHGNRRPRSPTTAVTGDGRRLTTAVTGGGCSMTAVTGDGGPDDGDRRRRRPLTTAATDVVTGDAGHPTWSPTMHVT